MTHEGVHQAGEGQKRTGDRRLWTGDLWGGVGQRGVQDIKRVAEVGFFEGAGFEGEGERVGVGGDADGGDFQQFRLKVFSTERRIFDFGFSIFDLVSGSVVGVGVIESGGMRRSPNASRLVLGMCAVAVDPAKGDEADRDGTEDWFL